MVQIRLPDVWVNIEAHCTLAIRLLVGKVLNDRFAVRCFSDEVVQSGAHVHSHAMALIGASPIRTSSLVVHLILRHATTPNVLPSLSRATHIALYKTREILIIDNDLTHIIVELRELTLTLMEVSAETEASSASLISEHITVILSMNGPFLDIGNIVRLFHRWLVGLDVWLVRVCKLVELFRLRSVLAELLCHL